MDTCCELMRVGAESLRDVCESAQLDAQVLLGKVSGLSRTKLLSDGSHKLPAVICEQFFEMIAKRRQGIPVAYLIGEREFYSLSFRVSPAVLIPRPETEQLIDLALSQCNTGRNISVLDLGTGSGCIAITLALELRKRGKRALITAVDLSESALSIARQNAINLGADEINFIQSNWCGNVEGKFDLIVSNPPYIPVNSPSVSTDTHAEPSVALYSGADGCDAYREIFSNLSEHLTEGGIFIGEHGVEQFENLLNIAISCGFRPPAVRSYPDLTNRARFIVCRAL